MMSTTTQIILECFIVVFNLLSLVVRDQHFAV